MPHPLFSYVVNFKRTLTRAKTATAMAIQSVMFSLLQPIPATGSYLEVIFLELFEAIESYIELFIAIWSHLEPFGAIWSHLELFKAILSYSELFGAIGSHLETS